MIETVSYSELTTHRECPMKWNYRYVERLKADETHPPLAMELGSWWHAVRAADSIHRGFVLKTLKYSPEKITTSDDGPALTRKGKTPKNPSGYYLLPDGRSIRPSVKVIFALAKAYWKSLSGDSKDLWLEFLDGVTLSDHLLRMDGRWRGRWDDDEISQEWPVGVEVKFERELPGIKTRLKGLVDEVYWDVKRSMLVARDHKSANKIAASTSAENMMDSQLYLYAWGLESVEEIEGKISVIAYDRARAATPKTPAVTKAGTLSKSVSDYDLVTYLEFANGPDGEGVWFPGRKKDESDAGMYRIEGSVIERLESRAVQDQWNVRELFPMNPNVVKSHLKAAVHTVADIERSLEMIKVTGEAPRNLTRYGCGRCEYVELCIAQMMGGPRGDYRPEDYGLIKKSPKKDNVSLTLVPSSV